MASEEKKNYFEFLKPDFVYIPFNNRTLLNIKINMGVFNNMLLGKMNNGQNIYSTCSGKIVNLEEKVSVNGVTNTIVVENDFKEKRRNLIGNKRRLQELKKDELIERLEKFSLNYFENKKNLIVFVEYKKGIDNSDSYSLSNYVDELLETIDTLENNLALNVTIVVNSKDEKSLNVLYEHIGTYINLKLETISKEYNKENYNLLAKRFYKNESDTVILALDDIHEIYYAAKKGKNITSKIISISYNKTIYNVNVKLGTEIKELLEYLNINKEEIILYDGTFIKSDNDGIVTKELKAIKL